jgi:glycerol-3-phosphate dehydrogenase
MSTKSFDVIVIGGGINGAGIAREAAARGLSVALLEKRDFSYGTTFRSTKLIHGGLRYLEQYEIGLVRESLREREILLKQAPHLVRPLHFLLPIYRSGKYGFTKIKLGLFAYDLLSYDKSLENHRALTDDELLDLEPSLRREGLVGGFLYTDCQCRYPERLCVETILLAASHGAEVHPYTEVVDTIRSCERIYGVVAKDHLSGEQLEFSATIVVNAAGPWVDEVCRLVRSDMPRKIGGTKGTHILLPKFAGSPQHAVYVSAHQDGRPFFIIPWRDYYWVGTTDIPYEGDLDRVRASREEIRYLLNEVNHLIPEADVTEADVRYTLAGVRPLPNLPAHEPGEITRKHMIHDHEEQDGFKGLVSIIGGKLTTYRSLAEQVVDWIGEKLDRKLAPSRSEAEPLWGGGMDDFQAYREAETRWACGEYGISEEAAHNLIDLYGSRYRQVLAISDSDPALREPLCQHHPDLKAQVIYAVRKEFASRLSDVYLRRTGIGTSDCKGLDCVEAGAATMGRELGWSKERVAEEIESYRQEVELLFGRE